MRLVNADTDISETTVTQCRGSGTEPLPAQKIAPLNLLKMVTLFGYPLSLHPIYKRPKGLFSANAFYMNPSLCLCKPSHSSKQRPIEAEILNLRPDGFSTPRQSRELQFVLKVWVQLSPPLSSLWPRSRGARERGGIIYPLSSKWRKRRVCKRRMAVLVKGWQSSRGTRFRKCCQVESEKGKEDVFFFLSCCYKQRKGMALLSLAKGRKNIREMERRGNGGAFSTGKARSCYCQKEKEQTEVITMMTLYEP